MKLFWRRALLLILGWTCGSSNLFAQPDQSSRVVRREQIKCVMDHLQAYSKQPGDPVVIYLAICPETRMTPEALRKLQQNSLPNPGQGEQAPVETVLVLLKSELNCLASYRKLAEDESLNLIRLRTPLCDQ